MATTTNATVAYPILQIDLGKYKSVACIVRWVGWHDPEHGCEGRG
jgi:hypothetical protein